MIQQQTKSSEIPDGIKTTIYRCASSVETSARSGDPLERDAAYAVAMERLQNLRAAFDRLLEGIQKAQKERWE